LKAFNLPQLPMALTRSLRYESHLSSRSLVSNRKLDELATDVDDATSVLEELLDDPSISTQDKLEELHDKLEQASEAIDVLEGRTT
jgi:ElaB/YqjD/DUF883 family membrane-anchored ribosome-binding protein